MASGKGYEVVKDNTKKMQEAVDALTKNFVYVGIPEAKNNARTEKGPIGNAGIGYVQEHGSPAKNIPARPHLIPGVASVRTEVAARYKQGAKLALAGNTDAVMRTHHAVGLLGQAAVRKTIQAVIPPPLAEQTLARRRARGRTGETPLYDTGDYLHAISYVVRDK